MSEATHEIDDVVRQVLDERRRLGLVCARCRGDLGVFSKTSPDGRAWFHPGCWAADRDEMVSERFEDDLAQIRATGSLFGD